MEHAGFILLQPRSMRPRQVKCPTYRRRKDCSVLCNLEESSYHSSSMDQAPGMVSLVMVGSHFRVCSFNSSRVADT